MKKDEVALWPSRWPAEDGGPRRPQFSTLSDSFNPCGSVEVTSRTAVASTMLVWRDPGELYLLCHTGGNDAVSWVERIDPISLQTLFRSVDLEGGLAWPGGIVAHANGSLYVTFGRFVHRLTSELERVASLRLPRNRPYNSLVVLDDGSLAMKDFGGARPGDEPAFLSNDCEICIVDPDSMIVIASITLPEASIARLSALGRTVYCVGVTTLWRAHWIPEPPTLRLDEGFAPRYLTEQGEGYGWDAVLCDQSAWFLNDGVGSERFRGTLRDLGTSSAPHCIVRVGLGDGQVEKFEVNDEPGGLAVNPPAIDPLRGIAVGYDSANGVVTAWDYRSRTRLWRLKMNHAAHPLLFPRSGHVILCDFDVDGGNEDLVVVDIETGREAARVATGSPLQSVLFHTPGADDSLYYCSFTTVSRIAFSR